MTTTTTMKYSAAGIVPSVITGEYAPAGCIERDFRAHFAKLEAIAEDKSLVPAGAECPSEDSLEWAGIVLRRLIEASFPPSKVTASAEGGVAICFVQSDNYADFECLNTGEILGVTSNRKDRPTVWEIERSASAISLAITRVRKFFDPQSS